MHPHDGIGLSSPVPHAQVLRSRRIEIEALRKLARSDREPAGLAESEELYSGSIERWLNLANSEFSALSRRDAALRNSWYVENAPYDALEEAAILEHYRSWLSEADEAILGLEYFAPEGRHFRGSEEFRENMLKARAILDDDAIRKQARRIMPTREKLEALADAHLRSTGG